MLPGCFRFASGLVPGASPCFPDGSRFAPDARTVHGPAPASPGWCPSMSGQHTRPCRRRHRRPATSGGILGVPATPHQKVLTLYTPPIQLEGSRLACALGAVSKNDPRVSIFSGGASKPFWAMSPRKNRAPVGSSNSGVRSPLWHFGPSRGGAVLLRAAPAGPETQTVGQARTFVWVFSSKPQGAAPRA